MGTGYRIQFKLPAHVENLYLQNSGNGSLTGNGLSNVLSGEAGNNTINGGAGNDLLSGLAGNDTFVIVKGNGSDVITDFKPGAASGDVVKLIDYGFKDFAGVKAAMSKNDSGVTLNLGGGETLHFRNVDVPAFTSGDFTFAASASSGDTVTVLASGDQYKGAPVMVFRVDGKEVFRTDVSVTHASGKWGEFTWTSKEALDGHKLDIAFTNDLYEGSGAKDRNLWVKSIEVDDAFLMDKVVNMHSNSVQSFTVPADDAHVTGLVGVAAMDNTILLAA